MEPRPISPYEVRIGDRVRWEYGRSLIEGFVIDIDTSSSQMPVCLGDTAMPSVHEMWVTGAGIFTLLNRPLAPIPTDEGTVIRSKTSGIIYKRDRGAWVICRRDRDVTLEVPVNRAGYYVLVPEQVS